MNKRKRISLLVISGPEVRAFVHSGLVHDLSTQYDVSLIVRVPSSSVFQSIPDASVSNLPTSEEPPPLVRLRSLARESKIAWLGSQGKAKWRHYLPTKPLNAPTRKDCLLWLKSRALIARSLATLERRLGVWQGTNPTWKDLFLRLQTDCLISAGFSSAAAISAMQTASNIGVKTVVVTNSWKDIYVCPHIPVPPDRVVVWNARTKEYLLAANPHLIADRISISPSLHLQHFLVGGQIMSRADLCNLVGLDHARPFISYTAASPTAVENEEKIVAALMNAVDTGALPQQLQVLLRLNPMEDGQRFGQLRAKYRNLIIQKPSWVWDSKLDWCCALKQDTDIWCATVNHAAMNVSVPSTATLEFAALGRHVVNVCFDLDPSVAPERSARRFWLADFYADIREAQIATPAFTFDELQAKIAQRLSGNGETARIASRRETGNPVRHILESVHSFFH